MRSNPTKLLTSKAAPMVSSTETATSPTINRSRARLRPDPVVLRAPSARASCGSVPDASHAGNTPNNRPASNDRPTVNTSTAPSRRVSASRGISCGARWIRNCKLAAASNRPTPPPAIAKSRLCEPLAQQTAAIGAQRQSNAGLTPAAHRARQQQVRNVGAGDQNQHTCRPQHNQHGRAGAAHHEVRERNDSYSYTRVGLRRFALDARGDCVQIRLRLRARYARLQAADSCTARHRGSGATDRCRTESNRPFGGWARSRRRGY